MKNLSNTGIMLGIHLNPLSRRIKIGLKRVGLINFYLFFRKLAKSILMLIPIFGLHFALFVWAPYANMKIETQVVFNYIEAFFAFFNAFQVKFLKSLLYCMVD